jgi:hypothetical protein
MTNRFTFASETAGVELACFLPVHARANCPGQSLEYSDNNAKKITQEGGWYAKT